MRCVHSAAVSHGKLGGKWPGTEPYTNFQVGVRRTRSELVSILLLCSPEDQSSGEATFQTYGNKQRNHY
jgi:hypothetical protein